MAIAMVHKYRSQADEWLALASFEDSPVTFDLFGHMSGPWEYDPGMETASGEPLVLVQAWDAKGRKVGRNHSCPRDSG